MRLAEAGTRSVQRHQDHQRLLNPIQARLQHSRLPYTSTRSDTGIKKSINKIYKVINGY